MAVVIKTNLESMIVQKNLNSATNSLNTAIERMSTGYKLNHASDNAANYSISNSWITKLGSLDIATENASMGKDLLSTSEENYGLLTGHLQRIRDLTEQAANGTYGSASLKAIQSEIKSRLEEITRIAKSAEFNDISLMSGSSFVANGINLQVGLSAADDSIIKLSSTLFSDATVNGLFKSDSAFMTIVTAANGGTAISDLNTDDGYNAVSGAFSGLKKSGDKWIIQKDAGKMPKDTLAAIDSALTDISNRVTTLGSAQNRVDSAISSLGVQTQNLTASLSTIRDADVAKESSAYIQSQILQQASATLLATANQAPSIALSLI